MSAADRAVRLLGWLGARRAIEPIAARLLLARTVRESTSFFLRELRRPSGTYVYTLRGNDVRVTIHHDGVDEVVLAEVFHHGYYAMPEELARDLGEPLEILDLGANIGLFGAFVAGRWPRARIVAYEPDPASAAVHERTLAANRLGQRWSLLRAAAGVRDGEVRFAAGLDLGSHILDRGEIHGPATITVPMHDVLAQMSTADVVKMDIEGGEWEILLDPRFTRCPPRAIVLEYHSRGCPDPDPRAAVEGILQGAGLRTAAIWHGDDGQGMVWAWRG